MSTLVVLLTHLSPGTSCFYKTSLPVWSWHHFLSSIETSFLYGRGEITTLWISENCSPNKSLVVWTRPCAGCVCTVYPYRWVISTPTKGDRNILLLGGGGETFWPLWFCSKIDVRFSHVEHLLYGYKEPQPRVKGGNGSWSPDLGNYVPNINRKKPALCVTTQIPPEITSTGLLL